MANPSQEDTVMETAADETIDKSRTFKGHAQPSVEERLLQCRNFLADEDVNRCLNFTSKLAQIEEYLQYIEAEGLPHNKYLFADVKAMAETQKDWMKRMDQPPLDIDGPNASSILNYSTRLMDAETATGLQVEREAAGLVTQMREDHAPFTVERSDDQFEFLQKMKQDACADPDMPEGNPKTNLFFVENRAYNWALREPSLIPFWTNWKRGLPNKGIKPSDPHPWYRVNSGAGHSTPTPKMRALRRQTAQPWSMLPDYLQHREDVINRLLRTPHAELSPKDDSQLEHLLIFHAPPNLRQLRDECDFLEITSDFTEEQHKRFLEMKATFRTEFNEWRKVFRDTGVQIRLLRTATDSDMPGIFYVEDAQPSARDYDRLREYEQRVNLYLASQELSTEDREQLDNDLEAFAPEDIRRLSDMAQFISARAGKTSKGGYKNPSATQRDEVSEVQLEALNASDRQVYDLVRSERSRRFRLWVESLLNTRVTLRYLRPGEIAAEEPGRLYCSWNPHTERLPQLPPLQVRQIETEIDNLMYEFVIGTISESDYTRLDELLASIMYPQHLSMWGAYREMKEKADAGTLNLAESKEFRRIGFKYARVYDAWKNCLFARGLKIRMPRESSDSDFNPGVLYYRGNYDGIAAPGLSPGESLKQWAKRIDAARGGIAQSLQGNNTLTTEEKEMYEIVAHLQYPLLKRMDVAWRDLSAMPNLDQETLQDFKDMWASAFKKWLRLILSHEGPLEIREADPEDESLGDPGIVYYRGPFSEPDSLKVTNDSTLIPEDIQEKRDQIKLLLEKSRIIPLSEQDQEALEVLLRNFWRPSREYADHIELAREQKLTDGEKEQERVRGDDYSRRFALFIQLYRKNGFKIEKLRSGAYECNDPTAKDPDLWRTQGANRRGLDSVPEYFQKLLNKLWLYPRLFYRKLQDLESEINERLLILNPESPPPDEEIARLLQLLRPFLPPPLAELDSQLQLSSQSEDLYSNMPKWDESAAQKTFVAPFVQWLRKLQQYAKTKWLKILVWDSTELSARSFPHIGGRLYFPKPEDGDHNMDLTEDPEDDLPTRFKRYQVDINYLLKRRQVKPQSSDRTSLSWEENDRLRQLLRIVMDPTMAQVDDELRALDQRSRVELLHGEELTDFLSKSETWHSWYNEWIDSFSHDGIKLKIMKEVTQRRSHESGIKFIWPEHEQVLLPRGHIRTIPLHVKLLTQEFNTALRARKLTDEEHDILYMKFLPLITATYQHELERFGAFYLHRLGPGPVNQDEMAIIVRCMEILALKIIWERLKEAATRGTGASIQIFEPVRGELRIRLVSAESVDAMENKAGTSQAKPPLPMVFVFSLPQFNQAKNEYLQLSAKARRGAHLTVRERAELLRLLKPVPKEEQQKQMKEAVKLVRKVFEGKELAAEESRNAKEIMSRILWQQSGKVSADVAERVFPELRPLRSIQNLLSPIVPGTVQTNPALEAEPTEAEIRELGIELNTLLRRTRNRTITDQEGRILDYILRPLITDNLRGLNEQIINSSSTRRRPGRVIVGSHPDGILNARQGLLYVELQNQWQKEFQKWKAALTKSGVVIDKWFYEPDDISNVVARFRELKEAIKREPALLRSTNSGLNGPHRQILQDVFSSLERYVTESDFTDAEGRLMLGHLPTYLAKLRDTLFDHRRILNAQKELLSLSKSVSLNLLEHEFIDRYMAWYNSVMRNTIRKVAAGTKVDFSGKAERRGVQRATVELALNLLSTNYEQHRPRDKFRRVQLPPQYQPPEPEVPLCLPLEPWKRPVEQDPFKLTKLLLRYRKWKDDDYHKARNRAIGTAAGHLEPPINYNGPYTLPTGQDFFNRVKERRDHLAQIQASLIHVGTIAPRPLIHRLTTLINEALLLSPNDRSHPLFENEGEDKPLETRELEFLSGLCAPSWSEEWVPFPKDSISWVGSDETEKAKLFEFERDINLIMHEIPLWTREVPLEPRSLDPNSYEFYIQCLYDRGVGTSTGCDYKTLLRDKINPNREQRSQGLLPVHMWTEEEAFKFLRAMSSVDHIYFDAEGGKVARIPPSGHPENKYAVSLEQPIPPYIEYNQQAKQHQVRYNAEGEVGQPILQPNLYEYLQRIAYRLGREIRRLHSQISGASTETQRLDDQGILLRLTRDFMDEIVTDEHGIRLPYRTEGQPPDGKEVSIRKIARDLHRIAPDLMEEAQVNLDGDAINESERDPGTLIQMQLIQESNNNWEPRFPENEHVWEFAAPRLAPVARTKDGRLFRNRTVQYFSMRRWPLWCQREETRAKIESSGAVVKRKPASASSQQREGSEVHTDAAAGPKREQHRGRGRPPMFPFGETPYQQAFQSWRMEEDLKDVEELNPKPPKRSWFSLRRRVSEPSVDRYALPQIPAGWQPDNVSLEEKRRDVAERVRHSDGFPQELEHYYNQEEIAVMRAQEAKTRNEKLRAEARALVEARERRPYNELTRVQIRAAQIALGIDPLTEILRAQPPTPSSGTTRDVEPSGFGAGRARRPAATPTIPTVNLPDTPPSTLAGSVRPQERQKRKSPEQLSSPRQKRANLAENEIEKEGHMGL